MRKNLIYILPGLFAVVFIIMILIGNLGPSGSCSDKEEFIRSVYNAVLVKKYLDKQNHDYKTILYSSNNKMSMMELIDDTSGYYAFVKPGDSIHKMKNSEYVNVNGIKRFRIYFDCK